MKHFFTAAVLMTGAFDFVIAQSLSSQCQSTLATIVLSPQASCLNPQALVGLLVSGSNSSVVGPINNWLTGLCAQPACSNSTLASVVSNVTSGCPDEIQALGFSTSEAGEITTLVEMMYPTVRQITCTEDTSSGDTLCITETLNNLQPYTGTLTLTSLENLLKQFFSGSIPNVPSNVTCTDCTKAAYNIAKQDLDDLISGNTQNAVQSQCGASFIDGSQPSAISQSANSATSSPSSSSNGDMSLSISVGPLAGVVISIVFAVISASAQMLV